MLGSLLIYFIISMMASYGLAIAIAEKGSEWPIRPIKLRLKIALHKLHWKLPRMLDCTVCSSFWAALIVDSILYACSGFYFLWPISGFAVLGVTWTIVEFLNAIDSDPQLYLPDNGEASPSELGPDLV